MPAITVIYPDANPPAQPRTQVLPLTRDIPRDHRRENYPQAFEEAWKLYPRRSGDNPKKRAYSAWRERRREGHSEEALRKGVVRYAAFCGRHGTTGTVYVKHAQTFFGRDLGFLETWEG